MKRLNKILCMAGTMSLLVSGLAYAETEATYPDCVAYDYETGEETIIPAEEFMNVTNARTNDTGEQISPAYDISPDSRTLYVQFNWLRKRNANLREAIWTITG